MPTIYTGTNKKIAENTVATGGTVTNSAVINSVKPVVATTVTNAPKVEQSAINPAPSKLEKQPTIKPAPVPINNVITGTQITNTTGSTAKSGYADSSSVQTLKAKAIAGGLSEAQANEALKNYQAGYLNEQDITAYFNKFASGTAGVSGVDGQTPGGGVSGSQSPYDYDSYEENANKAFDEYKASLDEIKGMMEEGKEEKMAAIEQKYTLEMENLAQLRQLQEQLTAQQNALVAESSAIQKQEIQNAYDANKKAIELQQIKVQQSYDAMKEQQKLANTRNTIKAETAMGMIYGYGSAGANKNLEDTVVKGEAALNQLSKDAVNADTELQNKVIEINQAYELDLRKIEQWKAEETQQNYAALQGYLMEINAKEDMAEIDKINAINSAVDNYNNTIAQINMTSAETKYELSLGLLDKVQEFSIGALQYEKAQIDLEATKRSSNLEDLDLLLKTYSTSDYADLPEDVKTRMQELSQSLNMPESFAGEAMALYKEANTKEESPDFKYYTDNDGNVTAITYNPKTGQFETYDVGAVDSAKVTKAEDVWDTEYNPKTGKNEPYNKETKQFSTDVSGKVGTPADALNVPDGAKGGQCGRFVNNYTGLGVGDSYESKMSKMDSTIKVPQPGDVFVMPYSWTGHIGFVVSADTASNTAVIKDSNWKLDETVRTHTVKLSSLTGFWRPGGNNLSNRSSEIDGFLQVAETLGYEEAVKTIKNEYSNDQEQAFMLKLFREAVFNQPQESQMAVNKYFDNYTPGGSVATDFVVQNTQKNLLKDTSTSPIINSIGTGKAPSSGGDDWGSLSW